MASILKRSILICLLNSALCGPVAWSSSHAELDLPNLPVKVYTGRGSHHTDTIELRSTYRKSPLLGILYLPDELQTKEDFLNRFYHDYIEREAFIPSDEQLSPKAHCILMTAKPDGDLQDLIGMLKPVGDFYLASDNGFLARHFKLDLNHPWLLIYRNGRLLLKEAVLKSDEIPHF